MGPRPSLLRLSFLAPILTLVGCTGVIEADGSADDQRPGAAPSATRSPTADPARAGGGDATATVAAVPGAGGLRRLTAAQYWNAIDALFGPGLPRSVLDPDLATLGSTAVGAGRVSTSPTGVEQYEAAAQEVARRTFADPMRRASVVGCAPASATDESCARSFLKRFGRLAFRRTMTDAELGRFTTVGIEAARATADFWRGMEHAVAAILQSPKFLYRLEAGTGTAPRRKLLGHEVASRLSFLITDGPPDASLLDDAERGDLATAAGVRKAAERLLAGPRARSGMRAFFAQWLGIREMPALGNEALAAAMREESLLLVDDVVGKGADLSTLLTSGATFVNRDLARHYGLPAPAGSAHVETPLPADGPRLGFLGHGAFLAASSSMDHTSPSARGVFVRKALLCQEIPPAPPGVDTTLPEVAKDRPMTTRQRLDVHRGNPSCASCHGLMDPIGLAFETFDWQGRLRTTEAGLPIDPSGELDGAAFTDARGLARAIASRPELAVCAVRTLFRTAVGRGETAGEEPAIAQLSAAFQADGRRFTALVTRLVADETFLEISNADGGAR